MTAQPSVAAPVFGGRSLSLLLLLGALLVAFYVTGDLIGAKLFTFTLFGLTPRSFGLAQDDGPFVATVGILYFPLTFILTDIINEYFGRAVVRILTFIAIAVLLLITPLVVWAIAVPTISFNPAVSSQEMHRSFATVLGPSWAIVAGSCVAFAIGQLLDVAVFSQLRRLTGGRMLWLRSQGSTLVSQLIDSFVVIGLAFVAIPWLLGQAHWSPAQAGAVSLTNYVVKFAIAVAITPLLYLVHWGVHAWLGHDRAESLVRDAHPGG